MFWVWPHRFARTAGAQLLAALIKDMGLDRVTVEGHSAVVRCSRATYRVHLAGGSIHLGPGRIPVHRAGVVLRRDAPAAVLAVL